MTLTNTQIGQLIEEVCEALKNVSLYTSGRKMCAGWSLDGPFVAVEENPAAINISKHQELAFFRNIETVKTKMTAIKSAFGDKPSTKGIEDFQILCQTPRFNGNHFNIYFGGFNSELAISKTRGARSHVVRILNKLDKADIQVDADSPWFVTLSQFGTMSTKIENKGFTHTTKTKTSTPQLIPHHTRSGHIFVRARTARDAVLISEIIQNPNHDITAPLRGRVAMELHQDFS